MLYNSLFFEYLDDLEKKVEELEKENEELKKKLALQKPLRIEKIEYKINELKVKELKGQMHLGITAMANEEAMENIMEHFSKKENINMDIGNSQKLDVEIEESSIDF